VELNVAAVLDASCSAAADCSMEPAIWSTLSPTVSRRLPSRPLAHTVAPNPIVATTSATIP